MFSDDNKISIDIYFVVFAYKSPLFPEDDVDQNPWSKVAQIVRWY